MRTTPKMLILSLTLLTAAVGEARGDEFIATPGDRARTVHPVLNADPTLSLATTIQIAATREPGNQIAEARGVEASALEARARRWLAAPPSIAAAYVTGAVGRNRGYQQWDAVLELPLWWPGQRSPSGDRARAARAVSEQSGAVHVLEISGRVRSALAGLALALNRLDLARSELAAEEELVKRVARAVELQELAERELLLARSSSLERRASYLAALEESRHAEADYALLTGLDRWPSRWIEEPSDAPAPEGHPEILLAQSELDGARAEVERLERGRWGTPALAIGSQHEQAFSQTGFSNRLVAGLRIPLGRQSAADSGSAAARLALAVMRRDAERLQIEIRGRVLKAEHRLELAIQLVPTARERAEMSDDYLRLTERGFSLGEVDLDTLVRARARSRSAALALREAEILFHFHSAEYNQALGVVP